MPSPKKPEIFLPRGFQKLDFPRKLGISERIFGSRLKTKGVCEVMTAAGLPWRLDLSNPTHRWIVYGLYDPHFLRWAARFLPSDGVVVDSGANIGQTAMFLGQTVKDGKLFAFEPGLSAQKWLVECLEENHAALRSVEVLPCALGAKPGEAFLEDTWGERFHGASSRISSGAGQSVRVIRLSDFLEERRVARVDLWKLDVEGYEMEALQGADDWLDGRRVRALYVELYRENKPECIAHGEQVKNFLIQKGYGCFQFGRWSGRLVPGAVPSRAADALFLPKK